MEKNVGIHGGDIYRNKIYLDYSVNINPLGIPQKVKEVMYQAVEECINYPDILCEQLCKEISSNLKINETYVVCGNGASELFMAIVHALKPSECILPIPSFLGYDKVLQAVDCNITYYPMKKENYFILDKKITKVLNNKTDMIFLTNPNNPVGNIIPTDILKEILEVCSEKNITVILDECFIEFTETDTNFSLGQIEKYKNLIVVRAFTKIFAMPGVRLGYLICSEEKKIESIKKHLPEWNISSFAQKAGVIALKQQDYLKESVKVVSEERRFLEEKLKKINIKVYPSETNFLLLETDLPLYEKLLQKGILIRDCSNFKGFGKNFYRIAVKRREENNILIKEIENIYKEI